jgi:hypothetical protein
MTMKPTVLPAAACLLLMAACGGIRVDSDFDPEASFASMGSYDWADSTVISGDFVSGGPFLERRILRAVDKALTERGFVQDTLGAIDFLVTAFVVEPSEPISAGERPAVSFSFGIGFGYYPVSYPIGYGLYPYGFGYGWPRYGYSYGGYGWDYARGWDVGYATGWVPVYAYPGGPTPGTLVLDVFDGSTGELIWRGWAERALAELVYASDQQDFLNETVARILKEFPPAKD